MIVRAAKRAGLEVVSGARTEPIVVRKPVAVEQPSLVAAVPVREPPNEPSDPKRPWFKRKRAWAAIVAVPLVLLTVLGAIVGPSEDPASSTAPSSSTPTAASSEPAPTATSTTATEALPTRAETEGMVDEDLYAQALAAAALSGGDKESYIARRIANRLARRTIAALKGGDRSRARFLVVSAHEYPVTALSRQASGAYRAAQTRAADRRRRAAAARAARFCSSAEKASYQNLGTIKPGCAGYAARRVAAAERRRRERDTPPASVIAPETSGPDTSGPSTYNWCGKRDGDGDGIYCEG